MKRTGKMKRLFYLSVLFMATVLTGCGEDNAPAPEPSTPTLRLDEETEGTSPHVLLPGEQYILDFHAENAESITAGGLPEGWTVTTDEEKGCMNITAPAGGDGESDATLRITATGTGGQSATADVNFHYVASFDDPEGAFVLNEGNMTTENGSLIYITPQGYVVDNAYRRVNGTYLGNVTQDMYFHDGKIYIISQNGDINPTGSSFENDGMLVVADARTLKKIKAYSKEDLAGLDWPTHIAVPDEQHVYIRDNKGVWRLNMDDTSLAFVEGSDGAPKSRFAVVNGKVYTYYNTSYKIPGLYEINETGGTKLSLTKFNGITGIAASSDNELWIMSALTFGERYIGKYNPDDKVLKTNVISEEANEAYNCTFAAYGNIIYYASGTSIYRVNFNPENTDKGPQDEMLVDLSNLDDNARELYNGLGVHPVTGHVYVNTIKGVGNFFTTNSIWEFDFDANPDTPVHRFDNYTRFPAGAFFNDK